MAMLKPPHPGLLLQEELLDRGLSVAQAATGLGVTSQHLHKVIKGQSAVSPEMALRLEKGIGSRADLWLRMQMAFDLARVRAREAEIDVAPLARSAA